jgi:hypothetical protein
LGRLTIATHIEEDAEAQRRVVDLV